jgi:hypothetical protein
MSGGCNWQHTSYGRMVCFVSCIVHWNFPALILILWKKFTHGQPSTCRWKYVNVIIRNKSCVENFIRELKLVKKKDIAEKVKWNKQFIKHCTNLWMSHTAVLAGHENVGVSRALEWEGVQPVHRSEVRRAKKVPVNLWRANFTSNTLLHQLIMVITTLYIKYICYLDILLHRK